MNALFLDSSYLLALELRNDQNHESATQHWSQLVFAEVVTYLNNRRHRAKAVLVGKNILSSPSVRLIHVVRSQYLISSCTSSRSLAYSRLTCFKMGTSG